MADLAKLNELIIRFNQQFQELDAGSLGWKVCRSQIAGRGLVATQKYKPGDTIFVDQPLVVGPRCIPELRPFCVACHGDQNLRACTRECRLPVCSAECERSARHSTECRYLSALNGDEGAAGGHQEEAAGGWDPSRLQALTAVRCLALDGLARQIVANLHKIRGRVKNEVNLLKSSIKKKLKPEDEHFMQLCCRVLDANAFEVLQPKNGSYSEQVALRGLYPMASILNHSCTPNTTHNFNENCQMVVKASNIILPGCEITSTYSPLLLGTAARRSFLAFSKEFYCKCLRCKDPSEYGTYLAALKCRNGSCNSAMLPTEPLDFHSTWQCVQCNSILAANKIAVLQKAVIGELSRIDTDQPLQIMEFIRTEKFATASNHIVIQFKYVLLKLLGYVEGYEYFKLTEDQLRLKKQICEEILMIVSKLSLGQCEIKASCLHELMTTNHEIKKRKDMRELQSNTNNNSSE